MSLFLGSRHYIKYIRWSYSVARCYSTQCRSTIYYSIVQCCSTVSATAPQQWNLLNLQSSRRNTASPFNLLSPFRLQFQLFPNHQSTITLQWRIFNLPPLSLRLAHLSVVLSGRVKDLKTEIDQREQAMQFQIIQAQLQIFSKRPSILTESLILSTILPVDLHQFTEKKILRF